MAKVKFCVNCGNGFVFERIKRRVTTEINPQPVFSNRVKEEYTLRCERCRHTQKVIDMNYIPDE